MPVLLQQTEAECGAACLAMVLSYYGRATTLGECRARCGAGRDGSTAIALAEAGRAYGLRVKAYSVECEALGALVLPAILHWRFNHFVILERWTRRHAVIVDPAKGRRRVSHAEIDEAFTGVALMLEPGIHFQPRRRPGVSPWRVYAAYAMHTRSLGRLLAQVALVSVVLEALGLAVPVFTKVIVDDIVPLRATSVLGVIGAGIAVVIAAQILTSYLRSAVLLNVQARLDSQIMLGFFEHLLWLPYGFFEQRASGDLLMRLTSNTTVRNILSNQMLSSLLDGSFATVYAVILLAASPVFGLIALALGALQVAALLATRRTMHGRVQQDLTAQAESQSYLVEALSGMSTLKSSGAEPRALEHWSGLFFAQLGTTLRRGQLSAVVSALNSSLRAGAPLILLWIGSQQVLDGQLSLGTMLALNVLAGMFLTPLSSLVGSVQQLQFVAGQLERLVDVVAAEPEQDPGTPLQAAPAGALEFCDVRFRYDPQGAWTIDDVSFRIEPGQTVALVGRTGSGKSTLVKLALGLYPPASGEVRHGGQPIIDTDLRELRGRCGVVLQEPFLFNGSIRDNISFNDPALPFADIVAAAELAAVDDDIQAMPMGYETLVSEGGSALSGGQRQRLAIARALAHHPGLLVLDEATNNLDLITERRVQEHLAAQRCTQLIIAHRLSTVRSADCILVLDGGRIVDRGTHGELMRRGGIYARLVRDQLEDDPAAPDLTSDPA